MDTEKVIKKTGKVEKKLKQGKKLLSQGKRVVKQGQNLAFDAIKQGQSLIEKGKEAVQSKLQQLKEVPKDERIKEINQIVQHVKENYDSLQGNTVEEKIKNGIMSA